VLRRLLVIRLRYEEWDGDEPLRLDPELLFLELPVLGLPDATKRAQILEDEIRALVGWFR